MNSEDACTTPPRLWADGYAALCRDTSSTTLCRVTNGNSLLSGIRCVVFGSGRCGDGASVTELPESAWTDWLPIGSHPCELFILIPNSDCALVPEVGALCGSAARRDLCGGRRVTGVPTATSRGDSSARPSKRQWFLATADYAVEPPSSVFRIHASLCEASHVLAAMWRRHCFQIRS